MLIVSVTKYESQNVKISNMSLSDVFFQAPFAQKLVFGRGSAPDPAVELTTLPSSLVGWGGGVSSP